LKSHCEGRSQLLIATATQVLAVPCPCLLSEAAARAVPSHRYLTTWPHFFFAQSALSPPPPPLLLLSSSCCRCITTAAAASSQPLLRSSFFTVAPQWLNTTPVMVATKDSGPGPDGLRQCGLQRNST
jgi:hypothetical protein